jgi:hypothetical protein
MPYNPLYKKIVRLSVRHSDNTWLCYAVYYAYKMLTRIHYCACAHAILSYATLRYAYAALFRTSVRYNDGIYIR